ncbi:MAG: restriction endonuclease subunit S [Moraxella sp.]|uniref:restriction endonuclease subunit S n=1 Tax=Moraxella sp. TaxID=479 RepID=UPI0026DC1EC6|nr:restriction endonuclease subunit S [Moraxella sp.]MDO4450166.1 restriction endonuclease subunit S [Moraxella sp.]
MQQVKWAEFELQELFDISTSKSVDKGKLDISDKKSDFDFIGRTSLNNGVQGFIEELDFSANPKNTFSLTQIGKNVCQFRNRQWYASQNIFLLSPKNVQAVENYNFLNSVINFLLKKYGDGYTDYPTLNKLKTDKIFLPIKQNSDLDKISQIDFEFMEKFISEIENERLARLNEHLREVGLIDCTLTDDEWRVLNEFQSDNIDWAEYKMSDLFEKIKTKKLPYPAKSLPKEPTDDYVLPCLTSSFQNQGLNYFTPTDNATILKNVISIPSNSDVYRAYFQSRDFTVLSDAYAIKWKYDDKQYDAKLFLFMVASINQVTDLPIYSYKNKLGGWNVVKDKYIQLPTKDNAPDIEKMQTLILALQKYLIKDVVEYVNGKIKSP